MKIKSTKVKPASKPKTDANTVLADVHFAITKYGFEWGNAKIERHISDEKKGWIVLGLKTSRTELQIYVTRTGKVRVMTYGGKEWAEAK